MKVQFLTSYYPPFLTNFFADNPALKNESYDVILNKILDQFFADTGALYFHTKKAGHTCFIIIANCEELQKSWAKENNVKYNEATWMTDIAFQQIKQFKPDLFYLEYVFEFFGDFLKEVKPYCKGVASWISSPLNNAVPLDGIDLIFSSTPDFINSFKAKGFTAEYMHPAFDVRLLDKIDTARKKDILLSFVGGWSEVHVNRKVALKEMVKRTPIQLWGYSYKKNYSKRTLDFYTNLIVKKNADILNVYNGEAWGLKMYDLIQRSLITFNIHESLLKGFVGNMRMFEATGIGTMILNDEGVNLSELFIPGKEIETYKNIDEAVEKANYYIKNPEKALEIGKNAQKRTITEYNYDEYVAKLFRDVNKYLGLS
jgi:spore maturation protein CgeB